jgi:hydrogenase maturation protein HypF
LMRQMLAKEFQAPITTSAGRLFDAVASLIGLRQRANFEGQAAMELEFAIQPDIDDSYSFQMIPGAPTVIDWQPMLEEILAGVKKGQAVGIISAKFHNTLVEMIVVIAQSVNEKKVVLSGGCFQNRYLIERTVRRLSADGFRPYWHQRVPTNDGGIALGQIMGATLSRNNSSSRERKSAKSKPLATLKADAILKKTAGHSLQASTT